MKITDNVLELDQTPWRLFEPTDDNNDGRSWCVLWLQGFTSTIEGHTDGVSRLAEATTLPFAMLNYAGHGTHPVALDDATRKQQFDEVVGVYDELIQLGFKKIIVIGGSFGGYMGALLSAERKIDTLVLRASANYPEEEFELAYRDTAAGQDSQKHLLYRQSISEHYTNNAVEAVSHFHGDTYIFEHEKDEVISAAITKSYYNAAKHGNYIVIRGLKHSPKQMPSPEPEMYFAIIETWLETIITVRLRRDS